MTEQSSQSVTPSREAGRGSGSRMDQAQALATVMAAKRQDRGVNHEPDDSLRTCLPRVSPPSTADDERAARADAALREAEELERRRRSAELWRRADVPTRHSKRLQRDPQHPWWETMERVAAMPLGSIIVLIGPCGTGKTQMAVHAIGHACRLLRSSLYVRLYDTLLKCRAGMNSARGGPTDDDTLEALKRPGLLVVDEIQERSGTEWEALTLGMIVDARYNAQRTTIMVSNLEREPTLELLGGRIASRMRECGGIVVCDWPSFRRVPSDALA